jgi:hypothetical protein
MAVGGGSAQKWSYQGTTSALRDCRLQEEGRGKRRGARGGNAHVHRIPEHGPITTTATAAHANTAIGDPEKVLEKKRISHCVPPSSACNKNDAQRGEEQLAGWRLTPRRHGSVARGRGKFKNDRPVLCPAGAPGVRAGRPLLSISQQRPKPGLGEVLVHGKGFSQAVLLHHKEGHAIGKAPCLVASG